MDRVDLFFYYMSWFLLVLGLVVLVVSIRAGQQPRETRQQYYGRLSNTTGIMCLGLKYILDRPAWLDEILLVIAATLVLGGALLMFSKVRIIK